MCQRTGFWLPAEQGQVRLLGMPPVRPWLCRGTGVWAQGCAECVAFSWLSRLLKMVLGKALAWLHCPAEN